jgi:beta-glucosidase
MSKEIPVEPAVFPRGFMFGSGISDYQHFGNTVCDLSPCDGAMHILRYKEDFDILKSLGLQAFRTGVEWARLERVKGQIAEDTIEYYKNYLGYLRSNGVEVFLTFHHFTNPKWVHEEGGWLTSTVRNAFVRYVRTVGESLGDLFPYALLVNEPGAYAYLSYYKGENGLPPYHRDYSEMSKALENLELALTEGADVLRSTGFKGKIGFTSAVPNTKPFNPLSPRSRILSGQAWSKLFFEPLEETIDVLDFIGIDYYMLNYIHDGGNIHHSEVSPQGLSELIMKLWVDYKKPIAVTENGIATRNDTLKSRYLVDHVYAVFRSIQAGAPVFLYSWWSLLHGFEWEGYGYSPFFGLVDVDKDFTRHLTPTAEIYSRIAKEKRVDASMIAALRKTDYPKEIRDWRAIDALLTNRQVERQA